MPKKRAKSSDEYYRGLIRELEKENKSLKRRVKELEKKEHMFEDRSQEEELSYDTEDTHPKIFKSANICLECGKGKLKEFEPLINR
jgi:predicted RNase H-like nuclease (RuvC/YqgF family)